MPTGHTCTGQRGEVDAQAKCQVLPPPFLGEEKSKRCLHGGCVCVCVCVFERTCVGLVWGGSEHLGRGLQTSDDGYFRAREWGMREGNGSECGCKCRWWEGSGQPGGHRQVVLPLRRLSPRLPGGPRNVEQQVDTPGHPHAPPSDNRDGPRHPRLHLGKTRTMASQGAQGPRMTLCPVPSSPGQRSREGARPSHNPSQKGGPESRWHRAGSQRPRPGPLVRQHCHLPKTRPSLFPLRVSASAGKISRV